MHRPAGNNLPPQVTSVQILVFNSDASMVSHHVTETIAERMIVLGQAERMKNSHAIRLVPSGVSAMPMKTRTGRIYTRRDARGLVNGFKNIYRCDRPLFNLATIQAMRKAPA